MRFAYLPILRIGGCENAAFLAKNPWAGQSNERIMRSDGLSNVGAGVNRTETGDGVPSTPRTNPASARAERPADARLHGLQPRSSDAQGGSAALNKNVGIAAANSHRPPAPRRVSVAGGPEIPVVGTRGTRLPTGQRDVRLLGQPDRGQPFRLILDPDSGKPVIVPTIRGGSTDDDPWTQGRPSSSSALGRLYDATIPPDRYEQLLDDTRASFRPPIGEPPTRSNFVDALVTRIEPLLILEAGTPQGPTPNARTREGAGRQHDQDVRYVINTSLLVARASFSPSDVAQTPVIGVHTQALDLVVGVRTRNIRNSQSLVLRDADHYLSNLIQEWQVPLSRARGASREPSVKLARFSGLIAHVYDLTKSSRSRPSSRSETQPPPETDISEIQPRAIAPSAPGGRAWADLGKQDFMRIAEQEEPDRLWILTETPGGEDTDKPR